MISLYKEKTLREFTLDTLKKLQIKPRKELGQNFLISEKYRNRIFDLIAPLPDETIVEIGGGLGALTFPIAASMSNLIVYELDDVLRKFLSDQLQHMNVKSIVIGDFLKGYPHRDLRDRNFKVVGNIPYQITAPIIERIYDSNVLPSETILMLQEEVADRITAKPSSSERGRLTLWCEYHAHINNGFNVKRSSFYPEPDVGSKVVKLITRKQLPLNPELKESFFKMVKSSFSMKRKTLVNNMLKMLPEVSKQQMESLIEKAGIDKLKRAEELSLDAYLKLFNVLKDLGS